MTDSLLMLKENFLRSLAKLSRMSSLSDFERFQTTSEFLRNTFEIGRRQDCKCLNDTEKQLIVSQLSDALPTLESGLQAAFLPLNADQRQTAKIYRSAVQFLVDNFCNFNTTTTTNHQTKQSEFSTGLAELLNSGAVESLDDNLSCWQDDTTLGEFPFDLPTIDLTGVPNTHTWWTEDDRNSKS